MNNLNKRLDRLLVNKDTDFYIVIVCPYCGLEIIRSSFIDNPNECINHKIAPALKKCEKRIIIERSYDL